MGASPVVHFEMPYEDAKRVAEFYKAAFGWNMNLWGKDMSNYITAETTKTENSRPVAPGTINGGFFPKTDSTAQHPSVVIAVDDIKKGMENVTKAGGKIVGGPIDIPGVGKYASFTDSEGNRASILQSEMS